MNDLIVLTGACGGIGVELVHLFIRKGSRVIGIDINEKELERLSLLYPSNFISLKCDISDAKQLDDSCTRILKEYGVPNIWINNAGIAHLNTFRNCDTKDFDKVMNINFTALYRYTSFWMPKMIANGAGTIVNVASLAGYLPLGGLSSYCASKHAVIGFTKSLQQEIEVEKLPVDLILVTPGFIRTSLIQMGEKLGFPEELKSFTSSPKVCAQEIVESIYKKNLEITPLLNGKLMRLVKFTPEVISKNLAKGLLKKAINKQ